MRSLVSFSILVSALAPCAAAEPAKTAWCPPDGPKIASPLPADHHLMLQPGWVTIRMLVRPGAVPVTDVRVVSEAGGPGLAREWLPLVRQWIGCASNEQETFYEVQFTLGYEGAYNLPGKEAFGLYAFRRPAGEPQLPANDWGIGVCPIRATLRLLQPEQPNVVVQLESQGGAKLREWLEGLVPNRDYMVPGPKGNRIEFRCKVEQGKVVFNDR